MGGVVLRDGRLKCCTSAPSESRGKKEGQEKQDLRKRVWMDSEDGWHLNKQMRTTQSRLAPKPPSTKAAGRVRALSVGCGGSSYF